MAIRSLLDQFDINSDICHNGLEAIEKVRARVQSGEAIYRMIMMDFSMPECDGPTSTKAIRQLLSKDAPDLKQPFVCCLTAYAEGTF